jgi:hypothetical protein
MVSSVNLGIYSSGQAVLTCPTVVGSPIYLPPGSYPCNSCILLSNGTESLRVYVSGFSTAGFLVPADVILLLGISVLYSDCPVPSSTIVHGSTSRSGGVFSSTPSLVVESSMSPTAADVSSPSLVPPYLQVSNSHRGAKFSLYCLLVALIYFVI